MTRAIRLRPTSSARYSYYVISDSPNPSSTSVSGVINLTCLSNWQKDYYTELNVLPKHLHVMPATTNGSCERAFGPL